MNEIIQNLEVNATNGKENFCYISEKQLKAMKELSKREAKENKQLKLINQEHQQINGQLRQANKLLNEQYIRLYKDYIQLKAQIEEYQKALDETMSEKIDIENNWNKLREWIVYNKHNENTEQHYLVVDYGTLLGKMQELEGSDSNE